MAASPTIRNVSNTPLSNKRLSNGTGPNRPPRWPDGPCNFRNLSVGGADPPRCGCQRFWDKTDYVRTQLGQEQHDKPLDQVGWCMCEHHACFHENLGTKEPGSRSVAASNTWSLPSQRSRQQDSLLARKPPSQTSYPESQQDGEAVILNENYPDGSLGITGHEVHGDDLQTQGRIPDTARGSLQVPPESLVSNLPPIPSQCILPADISCGGLTPNSQSFPSFLGQYSPGLFKIPADTTTGAQSNQSLTDVVTPGRRSPDISVKDFDGHIAIIQAAVNVLGPPQEVESLSISQSSAPENQAEHTVLDITTVAVRPTTEVAPTAPAQYGESGAFSTPNLIPHLQNILKHVSAHPQLSTRVNNHEQRLDLVENMTSSFAGAQEVQEKFNLVDERIDGLDSRVDDIEKSAALNETNSYTERRRRLRQIDDNDSMVSQTSTDLLAAAIDRSEFSTRLENIENQLYDFQSLASPSWAHPWQVEVVFLPFGNELRGIWSTPSNYPSQRSRHNSKAPDAPTQTQYSSVAGGKTSLGTFPTTHNSWEVVHRQSEMTHDWLLARACSAGGKVEERLRSRGLVKMMEIRGPSARDITAALHTTFRDLPAHPPRSVDDLAFQVPDSLRQFHGLFESWIPLRKIHKDSRLQFLDPSEMVTPVAWNFEFLQTVVMKATGVRRLFLTNRESYIQNSDDPGSHWTWQKIRLLPRVFPDTQSSAEVREADALETCWEWDERLDPPSSVHSSFFTQHSSLSIRQSQSEQSKPSQSGKSSSRTSPALSTTPTTARPVSPLLERYRPVRARTTSMPIPLVFSPPQPKRRIASFEYERNVPSSPQSSPIRQAAALALKRRRISRSPSRPRDTPRWSVGPPSPYCYEEPVEQKRGTTPFAYATPHSNVPYTDFRGQSVGPVTGPDKDEHGSTTDHLSLFGVEECDSEVGQEQHPEDEPYEGLGDEMLDDDSDQERNALSQDEDDNASSELSSQPSEYPSTQPSARYSGNRGSFNIHVDEE